jgi:hypothetical protein
MLKIIGLLCTPFSATALFAATLAVDLNGSADYTDIQAAIDAAADDFRRNWSRLIATAQEVARTD